ncbi:MAG TPA: hypothetical protein VM012_01155 [Flavitalea sp.]|nr:hypothetical protein [Flavitalea sp.]
MKFIAQGLIRPVKKFLNNSYVLLFLNGFFFAALVLFYTEGDYESKIFQRLAEEIRDHHSAGPLTEDSLLVRSLHLTNALEKNRSVIFGKRQVSSFKSDFLQPLTVDLMTGQQACGGFSYVLGRILSELDIQYRFAQMRVNGVFGGHIIVEAKMPYGWVVLDPLYDLYFKRPDGKLASFADVQLNWAYYGKQVPAGYKMNYRYEAVRYTNWDKIPVVMPALKGMMKFAIGAEKTENFSFRNLVLRKFDLYISITLSIYLFLLSLVVRKYIRRIERAKKMRAEILFPRHAEVPQPIESIPCNPVSFTHDF